MVSAPFPPPDSSALTKNSDKIVLSDTRPNAELLKRFYARHDFEPVWTNRAAQAESLTAGILRAGDHGLDPNRFHAARLKDATTLPPAERELLLTEACLTYADALARGALPIERRRPDQVLAPESIDVTAVLSTALEEKDPAVVIEALAPTTPTYVALRQALLSIRAAPPTKAAAERLRTIQVNLERQRWLSRPLPPDRAWVNVADEQLVLYRAGAPVFTTRVVVGEDVERNQSPEFRTSIDASFYNPPWVIPADIAKDEILPKLFSDPAYLTRNQMVLLANGEIEQRPGPEAGLGYIMFDMPNTFDVYLHDTPDRTVFARENRRISHGCIRVQNPRDFAALLMDQPVEAIDQGIAKGDTTRNDLPKPVAVFVVYQTAFANANGALQFRPDFYKRDAAILRALQEKPPGVGVAARPVDRTPSSRPL